MSDISSLQENQCEDKKILEQPEVCPTCVPDKSAPMIDWLRQDEPYFDARNCEYVAVVKPAKTNLNFLNPTDSEEADVPNLREFAERKIPIGVRKILRHFNKLESDEEIPAFVPEDGILVDVDRVIKIKVVISAFDFNEIPDAPASSEDPSPNSSGFPSEIIIDDSSFDFHINFTTMIVGIQSYDLKYEFFRQIDNGRLLYKDGSKYVTFRIKDFIKDLKSFKARLEDYVLKNNYTFSHNKFPLNLGKEEVQQVKIELDNSDEQNPMKIKKVFVKSPGCDFVEIKIGLDSFKKKAYYPSAINMMNKFSEALEDLTAQETREWIDFLVDYVHPPIKVDYGINSGNTEPDNTLVGCAADLAEDALGELGGALEDFVFSALDIFGYEFDKTCSDDPVKNNPGIQKFLNPNKQRTFEAIYNRSIQKIKERERKITDDFIQEQQDILSSKELSEADREKILEGIRERRREESLSIRQQAEESASKRIEEIEKINPSAFSHPYQEQFRLALRAKLKDSDSILNVVNSALERPSDDEVRSITSRLGLCGFTLGLKKAFNCVLKQMSYEQALEVIFKTILKFLPVDKFGVVFVGLPPQDQVRIQQEIQKKFQNAPVPWQQQAQSDDVGPEVNASTKLILEAYTELIVGIVDNSILLESLKRYPGAELIPKILKEAVCPVTPPQHPNTPSKIKSFNLDFCNPTAPVINFTLPKFELLNPFKFVKNNATAAVGTAISKVLGALINKFLSTLEDGLCNLLEAYGKIALTASQGDINFDSLLAAFQTAFCPDKNRDDAKDSLNSLLNAIGVADDGVSRAVDCLGGALLGTMTKNEAVTLLVEVDKPPQLLQRVADAVSAGCPRLSDLFGSPDRVDKIFSDLGNMIPSNIRDALQDSVSPVFDEPVFNSICLTSEELDAWNSTRAVLLESMGINDDDVASQMELYGQRAQETLSNLADSLVNGVGNDIQDGLQGLLNPVDDPNCNLDGTPSKFGSKAFQEPLEAVQIQDQVSDEIFDSIHEQFVNEFISNPFPLSPTIIGKILSDTNGNDYDYHNFLSNFLFTKGFYHDSEQHAELKSQGNIFSFFPDLIPDTGFFPETVGLETRKKILEESPYALTREINQFEPASALSYKGIEFSPLLPPIEKPDFQIVYSEQESVGYISDDLTGQSPDYSYKIYVDSLNRNYTLSVVPEISEDVTGLITNIRLQDTQSPNFFNPTEIYTPKEKHAVFNQFLRSRIPFNDSPFKNSPLVYEEFCNTVFNSIKEITVGEDIGMISDGFSFGHEEDTLEEDDLTYVNPEPGSTEYTYAEEERILGRSKTNNPRVFFLDPEKHGGSYKFPPLYIAPAKRAGWLGISSVFSPEIEKCDPKKENILKISTIKKKVNDDRSSIKYDNRLAGNLGRCFVNKPFDLIVSKNALSAISGLVQTSIRIKVAEEMLKIAPITAHVKFSDRNFDSSIAELVYQKLKQELRAIGAFGSRIQRNNYWLLFLEQAVQTFERQEIKTLPKISGTDNPDLSSLKPEVAVAYEEIVALRESVQLQNLANIPEDVTIDLSEVDVLDFSSKDLLVYSYAYQKFGDTIFSSADKIKFRANSDFLISRKIKNVILKIFCVKYVEKQCEVILREMVFKEIEEMSENFYQSYEPFVSDLRSYLLTSKRMFDSNKIENFGTTAYEKNIAAGSFTSPGEANDVVASNQSLTPWADISEEAKDKLVMKIERYIRVDPKQPQGQIEAIDSVLDAMNNDQKLNGVVSLETFQDLIDENKEFVGESYISELFGDAVIVDEEGQPPLIEGSIGLKYGIRIIAKLPGSSIENVNIGPEDLSLSRKEKAYYCDQNFSVSNGKSVITDKNLSIPLCSAEVDIMDHQIKDFNYINGNYSYDLDCLLRKLIDSPEYKLLFSLCAPIKGASSAVLCFSDSFFMKSIGKDDGWSDDDNAGAFSSEDVDSFRDFELDRTKRKIRDFFAGFYYSNDFVNEENKSSNKIRFPDLIKLLFGGFEVPKLNLSFKIPGSHKIVKNPFNKDDEECDNQFDKMF